MKLDRRKREIKWLLRAHCLCLFLMPTAGIDLSRPEIEKSSVKPSGCEREEESEKAYCVLQPAIILLLANKRIGAGCERGVYLVERLIPRPGKILARLLDGPLN